MRYAEMITIRTYRDTPIAEFLEKNQMIGLQASEQGLRPLDWIAGQFLADADRDEHYDDWIARHVCSILQSGLLRDSMSGPSHIARKVSAVEITPEDKAWLASVLGHHPDVLRVWRGMVQEAIAA